MAATTTIDLSLLSPEVQGVLARGDFDEIANTAEMLRGRDARGYQICQLVLEAMRSWEEFERTPGTAQKIDEAAELFRKLGREKRNILLTLDRAREIVRYVFMFERAFGFDPPNFFLWLIDRAKERAAHKPVSHA